MAARYSIIRPKWLEHHQSGHLTKDPTCPVCMEEAGSKVSHRRRKGDRQPRTMHCDLAAFEASADVLSPESPLRFDKESKLLPIFVPMPKKDATCAVAAIKESLTLCQDRNLHQITGSRVMRIHHYEPGAILDRANLQVVGIDVAFDYHIWLQLFDVGCQLRPHWKPLVTSWTMRFAR